MMRQLLLLLSFLLFLSCENTDKTLIETREAGAEMADYAELEVAEIVIEEAPSTPQQLTKQIIKTANLRFETQDMSKAHQHIFEVVKRADGFVQSDNAGKRPYGGLYHNLTVRVPTRNFQKTIDEIATGVDFFDERSISQRDVSEEFVDLNARLKAKRALEDRYLNLLSKAKNVKEMLDIERELAQIREEIEAKQGRLKYLKNQVSLSTLHIEFYKNEVTTRVTNSYGTKMWNALKSGWNGISVFFIGLLHLWPFLILLTIGVFVVRRWIKKRK